MFQNNNFQNNNFRNNEVVYESTVDGRIIPVRDGEAMVFEVELGPFKMVAISNIPEEGKTTAPVYLKFKMNDGRSSGGYRKRFPRPDRFQNRDGVQVDYVRGGGGGGPEGMDHGGHDDHDDE
jgi:hypothetical protein